MRLVDNGCEMTLTLSSPITEEQFDAITDVDFDNTDRIWFHTKHGKDVEFVKRKKGWWIPCSERLPEERQEILATTTDNAWGDVVIIRTYYKEMHKSVIAWMPLPEPYREEGK